MATKKPTKPQKKAPAKKSATPAAKKPAASPAKKPVPAQDAAAHQQPPLPTVKPGSIPQPLRGMRDVLPVDQRYWGAVRRSVESLARAYGYERIDTPVVESTGLFVRSVGRQSDVVEKEMFTFLDRGGESVSLRPEGTAGVARAYVNHGMVSWPQPVKLWYIGPMFRYERPQHGRYRQHWQFGFEAFGDGAPSIDAELVMLSYLFYKELGVKARVCINSLGNAASRAAYTEALLEYYKPKRSKLCEDCRRRMAKNPLRLLDCKNEECQPYKEEAPQIVDHLDEESNAHFTRVLELLDEVQVPYELTPHLVRGLDYYTHTVFELVAAAAEGEGEQAGPAGSLGGGGRYDNLVHELGGREGTPACGFGIGIERAILQMKAANAEPVDHDKPDVFFAQLGDAARRKSFQLFEDLRTNGVKIAASFSKNALKQQLEVANRLGARYTLIVGQKEVLDGTILVRDMESGMQEIVDQGKAVSEMKKKLGRG